MKFSYLYSKILKKIRGSSIVKSQIHNTSKIESGSTVVCSIFDRHSFCGYDCFFNNCEVGAFTSIASNVKAGGGGHPMEYLSMSPVFLSHRDSVKAKFAKHVYKHNPKTVIGNDVWVGESVIIKAGVTIGDGAVIGMGSVVTKDVPPYMIYAGNPAKLIRARFEKDLIEALQLYKWWDFTDEKLQEIGSRVTNPKELLISEGFL